MGKGEGESLPHENFTNVNLKMAQDLNALRFYNINVRKSMIYKRTTETTTTTITIRKFIKCRKRRNTISHLAIEYRYSYMS